MTLPLCVIIVIRTFTRGDNMEVQEQGTCFKCSIARRNVFDIWHSVAGCETEKVQKILHTLVENSPILEEVENIELEPIRVTIMNICKTIASYWKKMGRSMSKVLEKYSDWNYRVDFIRYSHFWGGPTATLVPTANAHTWGVIWRLHKNDRPHLDHQEGVEVKKYYVKYLLVHTPHMGDITCRCYIQRINPLPRGDNDEIPVERWPSWALKEIMIYGAKEHGLPEYYIKYLKKLKHNGEEGAIRTWCLLDRYARDEPCQCIVPGRIPRAPLKFDNVKNRKEKKWTNE